MSSKTVRPHYVGWKAVKLAAKNVAAKIELILPCTVYAVPRGGFMALYLLRQMLHPGTEIVFRPEVADMIVDDICDRGETFSKFPNQTKVALFVRQGSESCCDHFGRVVKTSSYIVFPWEPLEEVQEESQRWA